MGTGAGASTPRAFRSGAGWALCGGFDTVEVNATFYRLPKRSTVEGWVEQVPDDFLFAVKASRYLTHMKRLREI